VTAFTSSKSLRVKSRSPNRSVASEVQDVLVNERPSKFTYQIAPDRLIVLEEVNDPGRDACLSSVYLKGRELDGHILLREDYPYEWRNHSPAARKKSLLDDLGRLSVKPSLPV
jgi:hypothetical protein